MLPQHNTFAERAADGHKFTVILCYLEIQKFIYMIYAYSVYIMTSPLLLLHSLYFLFFRPSTQHGFCSFYMEFLANQMAHNKVIKIA